MGFSDQAHMCHFFKREIQLTPTAYRQKFSPP
jgi:AraC-like DNA-binding protein